MRDVNRIYPFCNELAQLWSKHPDLRFGQIMSNIARYTQMEHRRDMFFMEDDELMDVIKNQLRQGIEYDKIQMSIMQINFS